MDGGHFFTSSSVDLTVFPNHATVQSQMSKKKLNFVGTLWYGWP
jgi:hypothetical protein